MGCLGERIEWRWREVGCGGVREMRRDEGVDIERSKTIDDADADADI